MKINIAFKSVLCLAMGLATFASCDKDEDRAIINPQAPSSIKLSKQDVVIAPDKGGEVALKMDWTAADLGYDKTAVYYALLISNPAQKEKKDTISLAMGTNILSKSFTNLELNDLATTKLKLAVDKKATLHMQIKASPFISGGAGSSTVPPPFILSKAVALTLTPASISNKLPDYFLIGNMFGENEWKNNYTGFPLFTDDPAIEIYTYTGKFKAKSEFKFISEKNLGTWNGLLGFVSAGKLGTEKAENISDIKTEGYYTVTLDPQKLTYSIKPFDEKGMPKYAKIGIIGNGAISWDKDLELTKAKYDEHIWTAQDVTIKEGEIKFRADSKWDTSWGGAELLVGKSAKGGGNIKISSKIAGIYDVVFCDLTGEFHFLKKK
ncbi:SusE domain-containing protein [Porphyromonas pogonae]|uniref:SusE domain-containing protein n=1 Tax=Porphyromonas pogonae TaxID=867595 RepID=UPI002E7A815B|nr:SusE domain-containing protein [Porphyromonas pogonae]